MNCPKCNAENEAGSTFCGNCGGPLQENQQATPPASPDSPTVAKSSSTPTQPVGRPPRLRVRIWPIVLVVVVVVIIGGVLVSILSQKGSPTSSSPPSPSSSPSLLPTSAPTPTPSPMPSPSPTPPATVLSAIPPPTDCIYKYWSTEVNMRVTLTNFGVPTGCVLVSDSVQGELTREDITNSTPIDWSQGGVMAFPEGVYSGFIYNGEYEIVPKTADPNPKQVFCNRVQQVVNKDYAFSQAQPLPEWGLPSGEQIVTQRHC